MVRSRDVGEEGPVRARGSTALLGLLFTTIAGSIGAELSIGQSVVDPVYNALSINMRQLTLQPIDVEITAALLIVAIIVVAFLKPSRKSETGHG